MRVEHCDVCIVGTGAAGGILAYRLAMAGLAVLSLEQGRPIDNSYFTNALAPEDQPHFGISAEMKWDRNPAEDLNLANPQARALYAADDELSTSPGTRQAFTNLQIFRLNGKMNLWNAVALRYSRRDFLAKDHGDSDLNWPITYGDLESHYLAVERLIGVCGTREGLDELPDGEFLPPLPLRPADHILLSSLPKIEEVKIRAIPVRKAIETRQEMASRCQNCGYCVFGCAAGSVYKFSSHLLPRLAGRSNYRLMCSAKIHRLVRNPDTNRIDSAECVNVDTGQPFRVKAQTFVLACGALETPRILFNSRDEAYPDGLANRSRLVGCFLQDTVKVVLGTSLLRLFGSRRSYRHGSNDALMIPRFLFGSQPFRGGYQGQYSHFLPKYPCYLDGIDFLPGWLKRPVARWLYKSYVALLFFGKPLALRNNRVVPSRERDKFGIPQVDVLYSIPENDRLMQQSMIHYGRRILRKCSGLLISVFLEPQPGKSVHYAGTCRLGRQSTEAVVNTNLQTFDHPNLYLCDGSVVPEISEKNLTLTIMALAERLAAHLTTKTVT